MRGRIRRRWVIVRCRRRSVAAHWRFHGPALERLRRLAARGLGASCMARVKICVTANVT